MMRDRFIVLFVFLSCFACVSGCDKETPQQENRQEHKSLPIAYSSESADVGAKIYFRHCKVCHGELGLGDGPASVALPKTTPSFKSLQKLRSDDDLYEFISHGDERHQWKDYLKSEDRWHLVNFIRSLSV